VVELKLSREERFHTSGFEGGYRRTKKPSELEQKRRKAYM
jgi:hypothetical protein